MVFTRRTFALAALLAIAACGDPTDSAQVSGARGPRPNSSVQVRPASSPGLPDPAPPPGDGQPEVAPVPDPEVEARAREAAEQAAFEAAFPMQGVTVHFLAQVFAQPTNRSAIIGYMRRGAQFRAQRGVDGAGCPGGWHKVPGDGWVCHGRGFLVGDGPQTWDDSPVPASLGDALPYAYARTAGDDVPQYWRLPTPDEERGAAEVMRRLRVLDTATATVASAADAGVGPDAGAGSTEGETQGRADDVEAPPPPGQAEDTGAMIAGTAFPEYFRMRMLKGFVVSLDRREDIEGRRFVRTVRGGYVPESVLVDAAPPTMRGVVLGGSWSLPIAITFRPGARQYSVDGAAERLRDVGAISNHTPLAILRDDLVRTGRRYIVARDGRVVREPAARIIRSVPRPPHVPDGARWIHVSLSNQSLVAYEGDVPVFATLVSTGKAGHETPTGLFQIQSKHVSATMDDDASPDGAYSIEDVPWTMYFNGNIALHGAFWHNAFGTVRSHGCVNLAPADARWLFQWTTPTLPAGWHGVLGDRRHRGTWVFVEP